MKKTFLLFAFIISIQSISAQEEGQAKNRLFVSANFGMSFGNYTLFNLSPQIGLRFNKFLAAGAGINGEYLNIKENYNNLLYRKTIQELIGLNVFARFYPFKYFMLQVQPEANFIFGKEIFYQPSEESVRLKTVFSPSVLLGGGLVLPSAHGSFITSVFYDIYSDPNSLYGKQVIFKIGYEINIR